MNKLDNLLSYPFKAVFTRQEINQLTEDLQLSEKEIINTLLKKTTHFSYTPISHFPVTAIVKTTDNNLYLGHNLEVKNFTLNYALHAEQSAIINAWLDNKKNISDIYISAPPCGHCRQFMTEIIQEKPINIHINQKLYQLSELLPNAFTPQHLNNTNGLLQNTIQNFQYQEEATLLSHLNHSYAPYSHHYAAVKLSTKKQTIYGRTLESVAYNPSVSPLICALNTLRYCQDNLEEIKTITLMETSNNQFSHKNTIQQFCHAHHILFDHLIVP